MCMTEMARTGLYRYLYGETIQVIKNHFREQNDRKLWSKLHRNTSLCVRVGMKHHFFRSYLQYDNLGKKTRFPIFFTFDPPKNCALTL